VSADNRNNKVTLPIIRNATAAYLFPDQIHDQRTECDGVMLKIQRQCQLIASNLSSTHCCCRCNNLQN